MRGPNRRLALSGSRRGASGCEPVSQRRREGQGPLSRRKPANHLLREIALQASDQIAAICFSRLLEQNLGRFDCCAAKLWLRKRLPCDQKIAPFHLLRLLV